jgi:Mor family transcriptional regulator
MERPEDIVRDILDRLNEAFQGKAQISAAFWVSFEDEIRRQWGGELQYIAKTSEAQIQYKNRRDREIVRDHRRGEQARYLARKYGVSERRIRQIVGANAETL